MLSDYGMPSPIRGNNVQHVSTTLFPVAKEIAYVSDNEHLLLDGQKEVYSVIINDVLQSHVKHTYFIDAPGGTGKTFVLKLLLSRIRSENRIAIAVASSGIAATLLPGGKTAHAMFKLPLNLNSCENVVCNISRSSETANVRFYDSYLSINWHCVYHF